MTSLGTSNRDPLYRAIVRVAIVLGVLLAVLAVAHEHRALVALPSFIVATHGFLALACVCVAFLALGRYRVRRDAASWWVGIGFAVYATFSVFYVLWWRGLRPDGGSLIGQGPSGAAWLYVLSQAALGALLLVAAHASRRGSSHPRLALAGGLASTILLNLILLAGEEYLPALVVNDAFTPLFSIVTPIVVALMAAVAVSCARGYRRTGDVLLGYVSFLALAFATADVILIIGQQRYTLLWYLGRAFLLAGGLIVLFGLLWEYVRLYRLEQERSRQLALAVGEAEAQAAMARQGRDELDTLIATIPGAVVILDTAGSVVRQNDAADRMFGWSDEEKGLPWVQRILGRDPRGLNGDRLRVEELPASRALRGETVTGVTFCLYCGSDVEIWLMVSATPLRAADGTVTGTVASFTDITAHHEMTARLERAFQDLQATHEELQATSEELAAVNEEVTASADQTRAANEQLASVNEELQEAAREREARMVERERESQLLRVINEAPERLILLKRAGVLLRDWFKCDAVGFRWREGDDFPYIESSGFPEDFVEKENSLCQRAVGGEIVRDAAGLPALECMCGNILRGRTDPSYPYFTPGGSFWSNNTTRLLATTSDQDRQVRTRNRCNGEGYESVALVPLRVGDTTYGLLQLNSHQSDRFSPESIAWLERIAASIALRMAQHEAEAQRTASEQRYRTIGELVPYGIWATDATGGITYVSPALLDLIGMSFEDYAGFGWAKLMPDGEREAFVDAWMTASAAREYWSHEYRMRDPEGAYHWLIGRGVPQFDANGAFTGYLGVNVDIGEVKGAQQRAQELAEELAATNEELNVANEELVERNRQVEEAREEAEGRRVQLEAVIGSIADGVIFYDMDAKVVRVNEAARRLLQWDAAEGHTIPQRAARREVRDREGRVIGLEEAPAMRALRGEVVTQEVLALVMPQGTLWLSVSAAPVRDARGQQIGVVTVFGDISPLMEAQQKAQELAEELATTNEELEASNEELRQAHDQVLSARDEAERRAGELDTIINSIADGVMIYDREGNLLQINGAMQQLLQYTPAEMALSLDERLANLDARGADGNPVQPEQTPAARTLRGETVTGVEMTIYPGTPRQATALYSGAPLYRSDGEITGAVVTVTDVTQMKRAQEALAESEYRYRSLFEGMIEGYAHCEIIRDEQGRPVDFVYLAVNPAFESLTGLKDVIGKRVTEIIPGIYESEPELFERYGRVAETGQPDTWEIDFEPLQMWLSLVAYSTEPGRFTVIFENISERKRAEQALRESEQRYRALFNGMLEGYAYHEAVRDEQGRIVDFRYLAVNQAFAPLTGYQDVVGMALNEAIPGIWEAEPELFERYKRVVETGEVQNWEFYFSPNDRWYAVSVNRPEPNRFGVVFNDITERHRAEAALRRSEERLNRAQEIAHLGSWELDLERNELAWSDEVYRIFGLQPQEFGATYEAFLEHVHPDDRAAVDEAYMGSVREGRDTYEIEHRVVQAHTGEIRFVHERCEHVRNGAGQIVRSTGMVHDITERQQAEAEVQRQATELDTILNSIADGVSLNDAEGRLVWSNAAAARMLRYEGYEHLSQEERQQRVRYLRPDGTEFTLDELPLSRSRRGETVIGELIHLVWPDGTSTWVTSSTAPLFDAQGRLTGVVLTNTDMTELQAAEEERERLLAEVQRQANLLDTITRTAPAGIVVTDEHAQIIYVNPEAERLYARPVPVGEEVDTHAELELCHPDGTPYDPRDLPLSRSALQGEVATDVDMMIRWPDGQARRLLVHTAPIRNQEGHVTGAVGVFRDWTEIVEAREERERLLAQAKAERERLFSVLSMFPAYVCLLTPDYECAFANKTFTDLFGEGKPHQKCHDLLFERDKPCEDCQSYDCLENGKPKVWEWLSPLNTYFEVYDYPFIDTDGTQLVLEVGFDINDRKMTEQELQAHRERLEELVADRTQALSESRERLRELAAELAMAEHRERQRVASLLHDEVAQPLGALKLHLSMLGKQYPEAKPELELLQTLTQEATSHARGIMNELAPPVLQRLGLAEALHWWSDVVRERYGLSVRVAAPSERLPLEPPLEVALFQAIKELIQNAVKHAQATQVQVEAELEEGHLRVTVADNGVGFDPENITVQGEGGFGLFSVQERMAHLGGEMRVESRPGQGARITLRLPRA